MQKTLLSAGLLLSTIGSYNGDVAAFGNVNCHNLMDTCKTSTMKCEGFTLTGSDTPLYKAEEKKAVSDAARTCSGFVTGQKMDQAEACSLACDHYLGKYCKEGTSCN